MGTKSSKGSRYEREFAKRLSLWWTEGETDDRFWRSSNSGGRATVRRGSGRKTHGQCGDIAATHPDAQAFIDVLSVELKFGYSKFTVADVFDKAPTHKEQKWESFWKQAIAGSEGNPSFAWMLVTKRNLREAMVWLPGHFIHALRQSCGVRPPTLQFYYDSELVYGMTLGEWFDRITPDDIRDVKEYVKY